MSKQVQVTIGDATKIHPPIPASSGSDIVICNPPYGERLGEKEKLELMYAEYGTNLRDNFNGYSAVIFTGNMDSAKKIPLRPKSKIQLFNGRIECQVLNYPLKKSCP